MRKPWWIFMYSVHHDDPLSENKADACMRKWLVEKCLDVVWSFAIYKPRANIFRLGNVCWAAFGSGKFCEDLLALTFSGGEKCNEGDPLGCVMAVWEFLAVKLVGLGSEICWTFGSGRFCEDFLWLEELGEGSVLDCCETTAWDLAGAGKFVCGGVLNCETLGSNEWGIICGGTKDTGTDGWCAKGKGIICWETLECGKIVWDLLGAWILVCGRVTWGIANVSKIDGWRTIADGRTTGDSWILEATVFCKEPSMVPGKSGVPNTQINEPVP